MSREARRLVLEDNLSGEVEGVLGESYARVKRQEVGYMLVLAKMFAGGRARFGSLESV